MMHDILPVAVTSSLLIGGVLGYVLVLARRLTSPKATFWMPRCDERNCPYARFKPPYLTDDYLNDAAAKALGDEVAAVKSAHMRLSNAAAVHSH